MKAKVFVLYDGRAKGGDTDRASALSSASSEAEARREGAEEWKGYDACWFEYDLVTKDGVDEAINERIRMDLPPNGDV